MVGKDHHIAGAVTFVDSACRIGENERAHAKEFEHAHREGELFVIVPFIKMKPAGHADDPFPPHRAEHQLARMGCNGGHKEIGNVGIID